MNSKQIRQEFHDFFRGKGHTIVPSSPVVPFDDPTLMFTNAGMNQFKPIFLGTVDAKSEFGRLRRAANTQKCIRAGGKHNDLDDVGQDTYHHTFFEMLGNWSFGDYFKKEAIEWAWELLTKVWRIDKSRLHATYFGGLRRGTEAQRHEGTKNDEVQSSKFKVQSATEEVGDPSRSDQQITKSPNHQIAKSDGWELEPDYEARDLWASVTDIDPTHIHPGNMKDNFWEMGETGPCGPCSEIHIDLTPDKSGGHLVNKGDARVMEIWNLVFIQFNRDSGGKLTPLPAKHVDTGMGFERLCAVLQGMAPVRSIPTKGTTPASPPPGKGGLGRVSNYNTDVFAPLFDAIRKRTGAPAYQGTLPPSPSERGELRMANGEDRNQSRERERADNQYRDSHGAVLAGAKGTEAQRHEGITKSPNHQIAKSMDQAMIDVSYRVIADHVRCLTFALTDGAIPSNEGRGYVLRRILRRAVRYGRQYMNMHEPFLCDLVAPLVEHMADAFPELRTAHRGKNIEHVGELIREEEASFLKTLDRGIRLFNQEVEFRLQFAKDEAKEIAYDLGAPGELAESSIPSEVIPGGVAFVLHDTYGFPIDLTVLMAQERGMTVDIKEYERLMEEAREKSRGQVSRVLPLVMTGTPWTQDEQKPLFVGYDTLESEARILRTVLTQGASSSHGSPIYAGQQGVLVLDKTPFYAEKGGQVGDDGLIISPSGEFKVDETREIDGVVALIGCCIEGEIHQFSESALNEPRPSRSDYCQDVPVSELPPELAAKVRDMQEHHIRIERGRSEPVRAIVNTEHRRPTMQNHTSTHILNWALREVLEIGGGGKVDQKGSLVDPEKTRFDFSHNKPLTDDELARIEKLCNDRIKEALPVYAAIREQDYVDQKKAREINTLRAVFGEKYPDRVRVVSVGAPIEEMLRDPRNPKWMKNPVEFCGGTHVANTREIEAFVLTHEEGVAKGVRRVIGISGDKAKEAESLGRELLAEVNALHGVPAAARNQSRDREGADGLNTARVADFQKRLTGALIPLRVRREIQTILANVQQAIKEQAKESAAASGEAAMDAVAALLKNAQTIGGVTVVVGRVPSATSDALRGAIDWVRNKVPASAVLLGCVADNKVTLIAGMSKAVVERGIKAGDLIKEICPLVGGKGGGRPDMAQGGGSNPGGLANALRSAGAWIANKLS